MSSKNAPSLIFGLVFLFMGVMAYAADFRVVAAPKIIAYDAPSQEGKKVYIFSQGYPLEVIVNLGEWLKVRDFSGSLSWVEAKQTSAKKIAMVTNAGTPMRQTDSENAPLVATLEKDVLVEVLADNKNGWMKIRHVGGASGFVQGVQLWGGQ